MGLRERRKEQIAVISENQTPEKVVDDPALRPASVPKAQDLSQLGEWIKDDDKSVFQLYSKAHPTGDTTEEREEMEFQVIGNVSKAFLQGGGNFSKHNLSITVAEDKLAHVKAYINSAPNRNESNFVLPFENGIAKFGTKVGGETEFKVAWDGRDMKELDNIDERYPLSSLALIIKGAQVLVEFSLKTWDIKKPEAHGCSFELLSIGLMKDAPIEQPKKRRMAY